MAAHTFGFMGTDEQWHNILIFIDPKHREQVRGLIQAAYWGTYAGWCFGRQLGLNAKSQICFWTAEAPIEIEFLRRTKARPIAFYTSPTIQEVVDDYMAAGMPLHELHAALEAYVIYCHEKCVARRNDVAEDEGEDVLL